MRVCTAEVAGSRPRPSRTSPSRCHPPWPVPGASARVPPCPIRCHPDARRARGIPAVRQGCPSAVSMLSSCCWPDAGREHDDGRDPPSLSSGRRHHSGRRAHRCAGATDADPELPASVSDIGSAAGAASVSTARLGDIDRTRISPSRRSRVGARRRDPRLSGGTSSPTRPAARGVRGNLTGRSGPTRRTTAGLLPTSGGPMSQRQTPRYTIDAPPRTWCGDHLQGLGLAGLVARWRSWSL